MRIHSAASRVSLAHVLLGLVLGLNSCESTGSWVDPPASPVDASPPAAAPTLSWEFDGCVSDGIPSTDVYLEVNGNLHSVVDNAKAEYVELERNDWPRWGIPAGAETACLSWFAGAGDVVYVLREGRQLEVYRAILKERDAGAPFKRIKSIAL